MCTAIRVRGLSLLGECGSHHYCPTVLTFAPVLVA
jgi:hypothetical protein